MFCDPGTAMFPEAQPSIATIFLAKLTRLDIIAKLVILRFTKFPACLLSSSRHQDSLIQTFVSLAPA